MLLNNSCMVNQSLMAVSSSGMVVGPCPLEPSGQVSGWGASEEALAPEDDAPVFGVVGGHFPIVSTKGASDGMVITTSST